MCHRLNDGQGRGGSSQEGFTRKETREQKRKREESEERRQEGRRPDMSCSCLGDELGEQSQSQAEQG